MKSPYASDLQLNESLSTFFFCQSVQLKQTKSGKQYLALKLQDRTGTVEGRMWNVPRDLDVAGDASKWTFVKVQGTVCEFNDEFQINVQRVRAATGDEVSFEDLFQRSERPPEEMWSELWGLADEHLGDAFLSQVAHHLLEVHREAYCSAPAGKSTHHAYYGGLLEHSLSMAHAAVLISPHYRLDSSLMVAAALLHDVGKIFELTYEPGREFEYSLEGNLLGHISLGMDLVARASDLVIAKIGNPITYQNDRRKKLELLHLIASHHGLLEYGSPKVPLMREAVAFHLIDMVDSKLGICDAALRGDKTPGDLTSWVRELGGPLLRPAALEPTVLGPTGPVPIAAAQESGLLSFPSAPDEVGT